MLELGQLLVAKKNIPIVKLPPKIIQAFKRVLKSQIKTVTPRFVLRFSKRHDVRDVRAREYMKLNHSNLNEYHTYRSLIS